MPHAMTNHRMVSALELTKIGSSRYITVAPTTGHTAAAIADAAGGAVVAGLVSHEGRGHSAMRPATPTKNSTETTGICLTLHPPGGCRTRPHPEKVCFPV